jgi:signal peptidase I
MTRRARTLLCIGLLSLSAVILIPVVSLISFRITNLSMAPTIPKDAHIVFNRFGGSHFARGVVAGYHTTNSDQEPILDLKRIIGLPGETVIIVNGKASIEGVVWEDVYGHFEDKPEFLPAELRRPQRITLGTDEIFVLGDNRWRSWDSRMRGPVKMTDFVYWDPLYIIH